MRHDEIEHLLFSQLADAERPDLFRYGVNRRNFLFGAGLLATPVEALAKFTTTPQVSLRGSILSIVFGQHVWHLDGQRFGRSARPYLDLRDDGAYFGLRSAYFPGTNLRVDLHALLRPTISGWNLTIRFRHLKIEMSSSLMEWMTGQSITRPLGRRRIQLGDQVLAFPGGTATFTPANCLTLKLAGNDIKVGGRVSCHCRSMTISPGCQLEEGSLTSVAGLTRRPFSNVLIHDPLLSEECAVQLSPNGAQFRPDAICALRAEVFGSGLRRQSALLIEGSGNFASSAAWTGLGGIELDRAVALLTPERSSVVGTPVGGQLIRSNSAIMRVHPQRSGTLVAHFDRGTMVDSERPVAIAAIGLPSVETSTELIFPADNPGQFTSNSGSVGAGTVSPSRGAGGKGETSEADYYRIEDLPGSRERVLDDTRGPESDAFFNGETPLPLENALVVVRRSSDLLNLRFRFVGFELRSWNRARPYLRRTSSEAEARIIVEFQPQHIWETVFDKPASCESPKEYAKAAMSRRSRIVLRPVGNSWSRMRLTLENLLDWSALELVVDDRAKLERQEPLDDQLQGFLRLDRDSTLNDLFDAVTDKIRKPASDTTALVLADRLTFSPSESVSKGVLRSASPPADPASVTPGKIKGFPLVAAETPAASQSPENTPVRFVPQSKGSAPGTPLWNVRLDRHGRKNVRAIWSDYLVEGRFTHAADLPKEKDRPLDPVNSIEIVAQTSFYGMPALRRIDPKDAGSDLGEELRKIPRTEVIRPSKPYQFLNSTKLSKNPIEVGIAIPSTLDDADITLTSLGAIFDARWSRDPVRLRPTLDQPRPKRPPDGYALEQFAYETALGRDVRVIAIRKGFLFPLGVRASFTTLVERYFLPDPNNEGGVTSFEMKRRFIECRQTPKPYPGFNQPYSGNDFPTSTITMETYQTPDLIDPDAECDPDEANCQSIKDRLIEFDPTLTLPEGVHIFWPQALGSDRSTLKFQWRTDSGALVSSPLIWVDNNYVGSPKTMRALVKGYYNTLPAGGLRTAQFFGARQRYAAEEDEGETQFDTDSWEMKARGHLLANPDGSDPENADGHEVFSMDGRMEGDDQPPFYPWMDRGRIVIHPLDRLLGKPQGLIEVSYHDAYRKYGFGALGNAPEIYLKVLKPAIKLDVSSRSNTTGGVATPNTLVAALSRRTGIVGGMPKTARAIASSGLTDPLVSESESGFDFSKAEANNFDPSEFFGLGDAKLLGVLSLKDVIDASGALNKAPKLVEQIGYGALEENGGLDRIKAMALTAKDLSIAFFKEYEKIDEQLSNSELGLGIDKLYPELGARIKAAKDIGEDFNEIAKAETLSNMLAHTQKIIRVGRPLIREMAKVARNPIPAIADEIVSGFKAMVEVLGGGLRNAWKDLAERILADIRSRLEDRICEIIADPQLATALLGVSEATHCADLLRDPRSFQQARGQAMLGEQLAGPMAQLFEIATDLETIATERVAFSGEYFRRRALEMIEIAANEVSIHLVPVIEDEDIRALEHQILFARNVARSAEALLNEGNDSQADPEAVARYVAGKIAERIAAEVDNLDGKLPISDTSHLDVEAVKALIKQRVVGALAETAITNVVGEADRVVRLLQRFEQASPIDLLGYLGEVAVKVLANTIEVHEFSRIARMAQKISTWHDEVVATTLKFTVEHYPKDGQTAAMLDKLVDAALDIKLDAIPDPKLTATAKVARAEMIQQIATARAQSLTIDHHVKALKLAGSSREAFARKTDMAKILGSAQKVANAREELALQIAVVIDRFSKFARTVEQVECGNRPTCDNLKTQLLAALGSLKKFLNGALVLEKHATEDITAAFRNLASKLPDEEPYRKALDNIIAQVAEQSAALRAILQNAQAASEIVKVNEVLAIYAADVIRETMPILLQSVALTEAQAGEWISSLSGTVSRGATALNLVHSYLAGGAAGLYEVLSKDEIETFFEFVIGKARWEDLRVGFEAVAAEQEQLDRIASAPQPNFDEIAAAKTLVLGWKGQGPAIQRLAGQLSEFAGDFLSGHLGDALLSRLKKIFEEYKTLLEDFIAELVPTSIEDGYTWNTKIEDTDVFSMVRNNHGDGQEFDTWPMSDDKEPKDLSISVRVSIDLLRDTRTVVTKGKLEAFQLMLLPRAHMATIIFEPLTFTSVNGSSPKFDVKVRHVEIGEMLTFLEPLREWMAPSGNGFFIRPVFGGEKGPGIEAGFQFGKDLIQVGSLAFQNVYLRVSAFLPFTNKPAQFTFSFASEERPFLISNPPYGGGGYVALIAEPGSSKNGARTDLDLSFLFGAVTAIKFGPLNGQGRIVIGFGVRTWNGGHTIKALFEAVGEGSIACFSISVSLRVIAYHYSDGQMYGTATFNFTFKVAFAKYRYRVRAKYRESNGAGPERILASQDDQPELIAQTYSTSIIAKNVNYTANQSHIDKALI